jgi:predicted SprT family Zn-dependent metalloprotease
MVDTGASARKGERVTSSAPTPEGHRDAAARLSAELEAALVRELRLVYEDLNHGFFRRRLTPAAIELSDAPARLGRWVPDVRTIEIARRLVLGHPWGVVVEVLKHEMAHQYVHEVLGKTDESAHGPAFRDLCELLGIDGSAAGMPKASETSDQDARVLERIAKLLALAESANVNEAQAAMNAAQRLMLKHNLESIGDGRRGKAYGFRHLGTPTGRVSEAERLLGAILGKHFFVEVIWVPVYRPTEGKRGSVLEAVGTPSNLEMAAYVHAFLTHTAEALWREHKRQKGIRGDRDRRTFIAGVMVGFLEKLNAQRVQNKEQGMIWVGDADLEGFYRKRHPRIVHVRHTGHRRTEAHHHGREAGRKIVLHKPVQGGPTGGVKLLGR